MTRRSLLVGELTRNEWAVLAQVACGVTNKAIARRLCLSPLTSDEDLCDVLAELGQS